MLIKILKKKEKKKIKKEVQDLYPENYKNIGEGIKEELNKWKDIP
jgi:hypothetical protein